MHIVIWILAALALAAWTLVSWGLHAVLALDPKWVGDIGPVLAQVPYRDVLEAWIPGWEALLRAAIDLSMVALGWLGSIGPVLVWVVWGLGALGIVGLAALASGIVALVRRATAPRPAAA
jgi:hypothetical protein